MISHILSCTTFEPLATCSRSLSMKVAFLVAMTSAKRRESWSTDGGAPCSIKTVSLHWCPKFTPNVVFHLNQSICVFGFFLFPETTLIQRGEETSFPWYLTNLNLLPAKEKVNQKIIQTVSCHNRKSLRSSCILWDSLNGSWAVSYSFIYCHIFLPLMEWGFILQEHKQHQWCCFKKYFYSTFAKQHMSYIPETLSSSTGLFWWCFLWGSDPSNALPPASSHSPSTSVLLVGHRSGIHVRASTLINKKSKLLTW